VVIEDDVEIAGNAPIDLGGPEETRIGRGTKIDNPAQIGHW
jgi:UDP-3-O-[3-hydroxymyristoyl] glucosamine N-acyltransferase